MMSDSGSANRLPFRSGAKQDRAHAGGHPDAVGIHVAGEELHRIVDRQASSHRAARRIDVNADVFLAVLHLEEKQLRDDQIGDVIVDRGAEENDPVLEQAGVNS